MNTAESDAEIRGKISEYNKEISSHRRYIKGIIDAERDLNEDDVKGIFEAAKIMASYKSRISAYWNALYIIARNS